MKSIYSWLPILLFTVALIGCGASDTSGDANDPAAAGGSDSAQMQDETGDVSEQPEE